jgi:hypothetical protein
MDRSMAAVLMGLLLGAGQTLADDPPLNDSYGFLPTEIYKLDDRINGLLIADLDGDKTQDIAVSNNAQSRIDLLLSSPGVSEDPSQTRTGANQIVSSKRMRLKTIPVNKAVVSIASGDFDGDGAIDLAFYGTPAELVILKGAGDGNFEELRRTNTGEAIAAPTALQATDVNRDGRLDLVLTTSNELIIIQQQDDGRLGVPERIAHTASRPSIFKAVDLDGDGGDDLVILDSGNEDPIRVRFSSNGGLLGPEQRFSLDTPRAIAFAEMDDKPGMELMCVEGQSGRVKVLSLSDTIDDESTQRGRLTFFPLPAGETRGRSLALGDVDGDRKSDVVVTDPSNAQILVYLQGSDGLNSGRTFPNLAGGRGIAIADLDGDGSGEVIVLSEQEKQIGSSRFTDGRLSFPAPLPTTGDPVALDTADLNADNKPEVVYVARAPRGADVPFVLRVLRRDPDGNFAAFRWGDADSIPLPGVTGTPPAVRVVDVNRDSIPDFLIFKPIGAPILLLGAKDGAPTLLTGNLGPLVAATPAGISRAVPGDAALLVAQNTFARAVMLEENGQWQVQNQFNASRGGAQIVGAASLDLMGDGSPEVVLFDRATKSLLFLDERDGSFRPGGSLSVGGFDFQGAHVADLNGDGKDDLLLAGTDRFGVVFSGSKGQKFHALAGYATTRQDAILGDLIGSDVNGDGKNDIVVSDIGENALEILAFDGKSSLKRGLAFTVFEKKSFGGRDSLVEPRDMGLGDVDGDGLTDIILICHDRVLIYRQDSGSSAETPAAAAAPAVNPTRIRRRGRTMITPRTISKLDTLEGLPRSSCSS